MSVGTDCRFRLAYGSLIKGTSKIGGSRLTKFVDTYDIIGHQTYRETTLMEIYSKSTSHIDDVTRYQGILNFILEIERSATESSCAAKSARMVMNQLKNSLPVFPVPHASTGDEGRFLLFWDTPLYHFEIEFFADNHGEIFFEDLTTREMWEEEFIIGDAISEQAINHLNFLT